MKKKVWQTLNKLLGKDNKYKHDTLKLKIDNVLEKDSTMIANSLNNYFLNSVPEITRLPQLLPLFDR